MSKNSPCAVKTKTKIASAFKELMNSKPFDKITVSDITEKCDIHRQTFYYHFQDRYELLDWIFYNELLRPFMDDFTLENMYAKFRALLQTILDDKRFYQNALRVHSGEVSTYLSGVSRTQFMELLRSLGRSNNIEPQGEECDQLLAEFFGYGLSGVVVSWVHRGMKESPEELTEKIVNLVDICKRLASR